MNTKTRGKKIIFRWDRNHVNFSKKMNRIVRVTSRSHILSIKTRDINERDINAKLKIESSTFDLLNFGIYWTSLMERSVTIDVVNDALATELMPRQTWFNEARFVLARWCSAKREGEREREGEKDWLIDISLLAHSYHHDYKYKYIYWYFINNIS